MTLAGKAERCFELPHGRREQWMDAENKWESNLIYVHATSVADRSLPSGQGSSVRGTGAIRTRCLIYSLTFFSFIFICET